MVLNVIQAIIGTILFLAAGYAVSLAVFREVRDAAERAAYSIAFSLFVPAIILFFLNYALGLKVFTAFGVYAVYVMLTAACLAYYKYSGTTKKQPYHHK